MTQESLHFWLHFRMTWFFVNINEKYDYNFINLTNDIKANVRSGAKNSRYAHSNSAFPRNKRILFNDVKSRLKCKPQTQLQMAVVWI